MNATISELDSIPHLSTSTGIFACLKKQIAISSEGDFVLGFHNVGGIKFRVVREDFVRHKPVFYLYEHQHYGGFVMMSERLNLAVSGAVDEKVVVYNLATGAVLKVFEFQIEMTTCFYRIDYILYVGGKNTLKALSLKSLEQIALPELQFGCEFALAMSLRRGGIQSQGDFRGVTLFVGGCEHFGVFEVIIPHQSLK